MNAQSEKSVPSAVSQVKKTPKDIYTLERALPRLEAYFEQIQNRKNSMTSSYLWVQRGKIKPVDAMLSHFQNRLDEEIKKNKNVLSCLKLKPLKKRGEIDVVLLNLDKLHKLQVDKNLLSKEFKLAKTHLSNQLKTDKVSLPNTVHQPSKAVMTSLIPIAQRIPKIEGEINTLQRTLLSFKKREEGLDTFSEEVIVFMDKSSQAVTRLKQVINDCFPDIDLRVLPFSTNR